MFSMKKAMLFLISVIFIMSCVTSQPIISDAARKKVDNIKSLISLTEDQTNKLLVVESAYLDKMKNLEATSNKTSEQNKAYEIRIKRIKKILTKEQYRKFDAIESNRIKKVPIHV